MTAWSVELSEYGIKYESRGRVKAQCLADFIAELTPSVSLEDQSWILHVDGSSNTKGNGAGIILEGPNDMMIELAIKFDFQATNNQAEYEAFLAGLRLAKDVGVQKLRCCSDSKLITEQIEHIPRAQNVRADLLSKLASTKRPGQHKTIIQETISTPSYDSVTIFANNPGQSSWMASIWQYLTDGTLPGDKVEASKIKAKSSHFTIEAGELFKRGFSVPLLKCLDPDQDEYVMSEIHRGICGMHSGARSMTARVVRDGYYWPTMRSDCKAYVQKCEAYNGKQFIDKNFEQFLTQLGINHKVTLVEPLQTNGQAEAANKVILRELRKRLGSSKGEWVEELPSVLWAYHCTPQTTTQETPYRLTYGSDAMIPVEVGEPSHRRLTFDESQNRAQLSLDRDLLDETREHARVQEEACKLRASQRYNSKLKPRSFHEGDLVWRATGDARKDTSAGKFAANWEGPFRILEYLQNGAYRLTELNGKFLPRTWNATHLKFYFS
uniref:Transposon Ty3-I Gag-Pol polyprotein n=1 Tax=Cajanus cajan TaxID=3821 RepID=A0A151RQU8_CAJCA|nr:Transposon Ty3-I Gag-Pol polyprotein [Cajanus cajan]